jgi:Protein of unknown function (DUF2934)
MRDHISQDKANEIDSKRTALLAYEFWRARGCPEGSPEEDWFLAEEQLRHQRSFSVAQAA